MTTTAGLLELAKAEGWELTEIPVEHDVEGRDHYAGERFALATTRACAGAAADGTRNGVPSQWVRDTARIVRLSNPGHVGNHRIYLFLNAAGKAVRQTYQASGSTLWIGPSLKTLAEYIESEGTTGQTRKAERRAESDRRHAEEAAEREAKRMRAELWVGRLAELGVRAEPFNRDGRVIVDGERLYGLLVQLRNELPEAFAELSEVPS